MIKQEKGITLIALIITIVVLIILAMATIGAVRDSGIITHAERAAERMNKAQIEEKANLTKLEYTTEALMNKDLKMSKQEFRAALRKAFEIPDDMDTNNDDYIEVNEKYAVHIKNTDLDVEVVEITNAMKASSLVSITYTIDDTLGSTGKVDYTKIVFKVKQLLTKEEYGNLILTETSLAEKETAVLQKLSIQFGNGKTFNNLDEAIVAIVNIEFGPQIGTTFTDIDTCLTGLNATRENLYYAFFNRGQLTGTMSKDDFINDAYKNLCADVSAYTTKYNLSVEEDGKIVGTQEIDLSNNSYFGNITDVSKNSTYKIIIKDISGDIVASEIIDVRNIVDDPINLSLSEAINAGWIVNVNQGSEAVLSNYTGNEKNLVIPSMVDGYKVISIGSFTDNRELTSVTIPETVRIIDNYAFKGCSSLTKITMPKDLTIIGSFAFKECTALTEIIIPENVTEIGEQAFKGCSSLTKVTIPGSVIRLDYSVFKDCGNLTSAILHEGITEIGMDAFANCGSLTQITIPASVTNIGIRAFMNCSNLKNIHFKGTILTEHSPWGAFGATITSEQQMQ